MYITTDDIEKEISLYYPIDNRNGNKEVSLTVLTSFTVFITLKRMKRSTFQVISHQVITGKQGKKYCKTLPAPFERYHLGKQILTVDLNLPCRKVCIL